MSGAGNWTMKVVSATTGTNTNSLTGWGLVNPQVSFRSLDDDELTFETKGLVTNAQQFYFGDSVTLYQNGVVWFQGTVSRVDFLGETETEVVRYVVSGPWWLLKRTLWEVPCECYSAVGCALQSLSMTKVVLFMDPTTGAAITTGQQISNIITYAESIGISLVGGTLPSFVSVPSEETRDLTLADVIRRCMQWTPDGVSWFGYASGVPVFNAQQRAFLSTVTLDLGQQNLVSKFSLRPRNDLVPSGVRFNYVGSAYCNVIVPNGCADPSTGVVNTSGVPIVSQHPVQVTTITQDASGLPDLPGGLIGTVDLAQLTALTSEAAPVGLAGQYYLSLLTPFWDGSLTTHEQECSGSLRPGLVLNLLNGQTAWATMNAQIQEVRETLYTGETTATFGLPGHLMPQNFATFIQMTRRRPLVTSGFAAVNFPGTGGANCLKGISAETAKLINKLGGSPTAAGAAIGAAGMKVALPTCQIVVCVNGNAENLSVYCPTPS